MKIEIIEFEEKYAADFKRLNLEWLDKYRLTESHDLKILNDPKETILDNGGCIYLATVDEKVIGTAALIDEGSGEYELAKMSVTPEFRGKGISKLLIEKCFQHARQLGAKKILLFSNSKLQTALNLYSSYGFKHVPVTDAPFSTADVKMEFQF
jgi:N-acetylglutamate synthase-like GNAT family acetyltransferase